MKHFFCLILLLTGFLFNARAQYCAPTFSAGSGAGDFIQEVGVGVQLSTTGASPAPYYQLLTSPVFTGFSTGVSTTIRVRSGTYPANVFAVWIDYNGDQIFSDVTEKLGELSSTIANQDLFFTANVPTNAVSGTRMRVICGYGITGLTACGNTYSYGEAEDYNISITNSSNPYCIPVPSSGTGFGDFIESFSLNTISNLNTGFQNGPSYTYYSSLSTTLVYGSTYIANLVSGTASGNTYAIWIDLNGDNDFLDAGEKMGEVTNVNASTPAQITMNIPAGTTALNTRMRVRAVYASTNIDPCTNYTYGETEDYNVTLQPSLICTPIHGTACSTTDNISSFFITGTSLSNLNTGCSNLNGQAYSVYPATGSTTANLVVGNTYTFNVTTAAASIVSIWIDYNQNGTYETTEWTQVTTASTAGVNTPVSITIPGTALTGGSTGMRVRARATGSPNGAGDACTQFFSGETEDYTITISNSAICTPVHGTACSTTDNITSFFIVSTTLSNLNTGCTNLNGQAYSVYPASGNTTATLIAGNTYSFNVTTAGASIVSVWIDYNQNGTYETTEWTQVTTASVAGVNTAVNITIPTSALLGQTGIRVRARATGSANGAADACTQFFSGETEDYTVTINNSSICTPTHGTACTADFISNVSIFGTPLNNTSNCDNLSGQGYSVWPATNPYTATLSPGNNYTLSVTTSASNIISVWADWNINGLFEASEWVQVATASTANVASTVTLPVPANATLGTTKIRVRSRAVGSLNGATDACTQFFSGETEDYTITVQNTTGQAPIANFTASNGTSGVNFVSTSLNNPTAYTWLFDGAFPAVSNDPNPANVVFAGAGCHNVTLIVSNAFGVDTLFVPCFVVLDDPSQCINPIISEYIEGSGNNKAIEIYNPNSGPLSLTGYKIAIYANGSALPTGTIVLNGTIPANDVFVVSNPGATLSQIISNSDQTAIALTFSGNDAVGLTFNDRVIDLIGRIGQDSSWAVGGGFTTDYTLVRQPSIVAPEAFWNTARTTYTALPLNTVSNIGTHNSVCSTLASQCATNNTTCTNTQTGVVGTLLNSNSGTTYPAPYGNYYKSSRHQFLYLASELTAAGVTPGNINAISFNIVNLNTTTNLYKEFTIKMGCTSLTDLSSGNFYSNVNTVFDPKNVVVGTTGWLQHNFDRNFSWDGVSNVVVEVSHNNLADATYTTNASTYFTTTPVSRTLYVASDVTDGNAFTTGSAITERTTPRFHYCSSNPNLPVANIGLPIDSICVGSCVNLQNQSTGATSFTWSFPGGNPAASSAPNPQVCYSSAGNYEAYLIVTNSSGTDIDTVDIFVLPFPTANVTPSQSTICPGASVQLFAQGGSQYTWTPPTGLSNPNVFNPIASPTTTTTYVVSVSNGVCASSAGAVVIVTPITVNAGSDQTICPGNSVQLNATTSAANPTYSWSPSTGLSNPNIANPLASPTATTTYTVTVSSNGCTATDIVIVNVQSVSANAGSDVTICQGNSTNLNASGGTSYSWSPTTGLSNPFIANPVASPTSTTTYTVTVSSGNNCTATDQVVVTVSNVTANAGPDVTICPGSFAQLNASGGTGYTWFPTTGLSNPNIANPIANPTTTTTYSVVVTNANGCSATDFIVVTVGQVVANAGQDQTICLGSTAQLNASGGTNYSWFPATGLSNPNIANPVANPTSTTTYTVTVSNGNCSSTDQVIITVNSASVNAGPDQTICAGSSAQLNAIGSGTVFWTPATGLSSQTIPNPTATPLQTTTYTVTILSNGCSASDDVVINVNQVSANAGQDQFICSGGSAQLNASGGTQYTWTPATGLSNASIANPVATPSSTTTYTVTVVNNGCSATDQVVVSVGNAQVTAGPDQTICFGSSAQLSSTGTGSFNWTPSISLNNPTTANPLASPTSTTLYTVTVNNNGCTATDQVLVTVVNVNANAGADQSVCPGGSAQLSASGGTSFQWSPSAGLNNPNLPNPTASPAQTTTYTVTVSNNGCTASDQVTVTVNNPVVVAGADQSICAGASANLVATGGSNYQWSPSTGLSNPNIANPVATPTVTTTYVVSTTLGNCVATDTVTVTVINVTANAGPDVTVCSGSSVQLNGTGGDTYYWTPGISISSQSDQNPIVNPSSTITYTVVASIGNCTAVDQVTVTVAPGVANPNAGSDTSICLGTSANLNASGGSSYSWLPATGLNNPAIANPVASPSTTTTYVVTINNGNCSASDQVTITVNSVTANAGSDQSICAGGTAQLNASGGNTYSWTPSTGLSNANISNPIAVPTLSTNYVVTVSDGLCSASDTVFVEVITVSANAGSDVTVCSGSGIALNGSGNGVFSWSPASSLSDASIAGPIATPATTTTYTLTVNIGNCSVSDLVVVTVSPSVLNVTGFGDTTLCGPGSVQLDANGAQNFVWSPGSLVSDSLATDPIATITGTTVLTVTGSNGVCSASDQVTIVVDSVNADAGSDVAVCSGSSIQLNASGGNSYSWSPSTGLNNASVSTPLASPLQSTTYTVTVSNGVCSATDEVVVTVNSVNLNAGNDQSICEGDTLQLNATGASSYLWFPASFLSSDQVENPQAYPSVSTTYYLTGTQNGCVGYDTLSITVNPLPQPVIVQVGSDLSTGTFANYQWQLNGIDIPGATFQSVFPSQVGNYTVVVSDANGCSNASAPFQVLIVSVAAVQDPFLFSVYPNPSTENFNLKLEQSENERVMIRVFNALGQEVYLHRQEQSTQRLNLVIPATEWADGVYLMEVICGKHRELSRLVKQ